MSDMRRMQMGRLVDFCMAYNERQEEAEKAREKSSTKVRIATQSDIDAFFG